MRHWLEAARRRAWIPLAAAIVFAGALGAGFQWGGAESDEFIRVFDAPLGGDGAPAADLAGFVTEAGPNGLVVRAGDTPITVEFAAGAELEALQPIGGGDLEVGDWIVIGGRDDNVNSYILEAIVVIPAERAITGEDLTELYTRQAVR